MWLPDDVIAEISAYAPDPRPLLLTCRQFYRVFTEIPDIAYWCCRDLAYLLPKHVDGVTPVWNGPIVDIIDADNLAVFKHMYDPARASKYATRVFKCDAVNIYRFLYEKHNELSLQVNGTCDKCRAFYISVISARNLGGGGKLLSSWLMSAMDPPIPLEIQYRKTGVGAFRRQSARDVLQILSRTYPLPEFSFRDFLKLDPIDSDDVAEYFRLYKKPVTLVMLALAAATLRYVSSRRDRIVKLLEMYNDTATVVLDTIDIKCRSPHERDILMGCGARAVEPEGLIRMHQYPDIIDLYLPEQRECILTFLGTYRNFWYTKAVADKLAGYDIPFAPCQETTADAMGTNMLIENITADPSLLELVPKWVSIHISYVDVHAVLRRIRPFSAAPGYSAVVDGIIAAANFEDI